MYQSKRARGRALSIIEGFFEFNKIKFVFCHLREGAFYNRGELKECGVKIFMVELFMLKKKNRLHTYVRQATALGEVGSKVDFWTIRKIYFSAIKNTNSSNFFLMMMKTEYTGTEL